MLLLLSVFSFLIWFLFILLLLRFFIYYLVTDSVFLILYAIPFFKSCSWFFGLFFAIFLSFPAASATFGLFLRYNMLNILFFGVNLHKKNRWKHPPVFDIFEFESDFKFIFFCFRSSSGFCASSLRQTEDFRHNAHQTACA